MTIEKKNGFYLKAIGVLLGLILSLVLYVWDGAVERLDNIEVKVDTLESRSKKSQWMDSLIISDLAEIKEELKK